jgi:transcriptional regulator with XRE-family HTH domain
MNADRIYREFGAKLKKARKAAKLNQENLSGRVGLSRTSITNIEAGRQRISLDMLFLLSDALGIPPANLLPEKPPALPEDDDIERELSKVHALGEQDSQWIKKVISSGKEKGKGDEQNH